MKHYKKVYEDLGWKIKGQNRYDLAFAKSDVMPIDEYAETYRKLLLDAALFFFDLTVKKVWLDQHFIYRGRRRSRRAQNGMNADVAFSHFLQSIVSSDPKVYSTVPFFSAVVSYLEDFFPDFLNHDPFKEPEYYKYPFSYITLDYLHYVHQVHDRLEILKYVDERRMRFKDFRNWANNRVLCHNDEIGEIKYVISNKASNSFFFIKDLSYDGFKLRNEHVFRKHKAKWDESQACDIDPCRGREEVPRTTENTTGDIA